MDEHPVAMWFAVWEKLVASALLILACWGAAGGVTNALVVRASLKDALRLILHGAVIAAGMGSLSMSILVAFLDLPPEAIPAGGASSSAAYIFGVFGSAIVEVALARIRQPKDTSERKRDDV